jgi:hypothetical protein
MNKIKTVICSINYCDLLKETLSQNVKELFDISIITDLKDQETKDLCMEFNVKCYQTDLFYINNSKFNRGMVLNAFLNKFKNELDWVLLLDADIVVPKDFEKLFFDLSPDINVMYGCRRYDVQEYQDWKKVQENYENLINYRLFRGVGYGYFQLFNFKSEIIKNLSLNSDKIIYPPLPTVSEADWIFRNYWSDWIFDPPLNNDPNQHNIPNNDRPKNPNLLTQLPFNVIHLGEAGKNSYERLTKEFNE